MTFEVEQKFQLQDAAPFEAKLRELGAPSLDAIEQVDSYFAHPSRDFARTDEAFRIRRVGEQNFITYKGPKIDATTKTRREIELPLPNGDEYAEQFRELLGCLGFRLVADVRKIRRKTTVRWRDVDVEVMIDEVQGVGLYAELEIVAVESELEAAKAHLASLAEELDLSENERRSYLELLLGT
jgi:adenylate cyclase class 2